MIGEGRLSIVSQYTWKDWGGCPVRSAAHSTGKIHSLKERINVGAGSDMPCSKRTGPPGRALVCNENERDGWGPTEHLMVADGRRNRWSILRIGGKHVRNLDRT